jgi:hypothetical protein
MPKHTCDYRQDLDIELIQTGGDRFTVRYFKQIETGLDYVTAAHRYGECVFHALACDGKLDNEED